MEERPSDRYRTLLTRIAGDIAAHHAKAVVLYGSMARFLRGEEAPGLPNDVDLLAVCNNSLYSVEHRDYGFPLELHRFRTDEIAGIARSLRYDTKAVALAKLYGRQTVRGHARDVIAACLLLGPSYRAFGIEQIEIDGLTDKRDYSAQEVLHGRRWWARLQAFARERRGPFLRWSDKIVENDVFED